MSEVEEKLFTQYLKQHPETLEELLPEQEWEHFKEIYNNSEVDETLFKHIHFSINRQKNHIKKIFICASAVAAVFLLIFGISRFLNINKNKLDYYSKDSYASETTYANNTISIINYTLPDLTVVALLPGSSIKYLSDYNVRKRDIYLKGKATFTVTKNKKKPFTVFCRNISTTALGTCFTVDGNAKNTSVILYEGKVVVKKINDELLSTYLLPGDGVAFNSNKNKFEELPKNNIPFPLVSTKISNRSSVNKINSESKPNPVNNIVPPKAKSAYINMQNENLRTVLSKLADIYHVQINYPTEIIFSSNISISIDTSQPIENILRNIAALNNLELKKDSSAKFYFSK
ncbi:MAG: FecR family protein [Arachidicoccus sp.]|nr:FecR family protein [Arachidicoccus sp.]